MKPDSINPKIEVGQYWFAAENGVPVRVTQVTEDKVTFDNGWQFVLPLGSCYTFLWHTIELYLAYFEGDITPKPGQIWVSNLSQDVFFIHPDQTGVGENFYRVLSDSSNILGKASLFRDVSRAKPNP